MSNLFTVGQASVVALQLAAGESNRYPRAYFYRGAVLEATVLLAHVALGMYVGTWVPAFAEHHVSTFIVYSDAPGTAEDSTYERVAENWDPVDRIANGVLDAPLAGHVAPGSVGEALARLALIEKIQRNRLELEEGSANNWVLYDDDSTTPLLTWSVTDKDGNGILMDVSVPARRTRGV
jgi:hypothetical protein